MCLGSTPTAPKAPPPLPEAPTAPSQSKSSYDSKGKRRRAAAGQSANGTILTGSQGLSAGGQQSGKTLLGA